MAASQAATVSTRGSTRPSTGAWPKICVTALQRLTNQSEMRSKPPGWHHSVCAPCCGRTHWLLCSSIRKHKMGMRKEDETWKRL